MIEKFLRVIWDTVNPQKDLDKHCDKLIQAKISQKVREQLIADVTRAKITFGKWEFILFTVLLIFAGFYALLSL